MIPNMDYRKLAEDALTERARIFEQRKAVNDDANLSDAEKRAQFERMDTDMDRLAAEARAHVEAGERDAELRDLSTRAGKLGAPVEDSRRSEDERTLHDDMRALMIGDLRQIDLTATSAVERRAAVPGTAQASDAAWAGTLVADTFVATVLESLYETSEVVNRVRGITTAGGELMEWPRRVSKAGGVAKIAENGTYPKSSNGSFDRFPLNAYKAGMISEVTEEMIADGALPVAEIVAQDMGEDLAEQLAAWVWAGTGVGEPHGLLPAATHTSPFASTTAVTADELIDLQHAIIGKYRKNASWFLNDLTARDVRKLQDANNHYLWQPALIAGQPDQLLGKPVSTDPEIPVSAANAKSVVFGDLHRAYLLRTVRAIRIVRSTEYGFERDTLALKATWRGDGDVADDAAYAVGVHAAV